MTITRNTSQMEGCQWSYDYDDITFRILLFRCINNSPFNSEGTIISLAPMRISGSIYTVDDIIHTNPSNGFVYRCTVSGTSAVVQPAFPVGIGNTVVDGTVTWKCIGPDKAVRTAPANQTSTFNLPAQVADAFNISLNARGQMLGIDQAYRMIGQ